MSRKLYTIIILIFITAIYSTAQQRPGRSSMNQQTGSDMSRPQDTDDTKKKDSEEEIKKKKVPSIIKTWSLSKQGSVITKSEVDTTLWFYHNYLPFNKISISNTFTGNNGGAYLSNDYFSRNYNSDFYFARSFDAYWLSPSQINYFNTTTPYSLLDYSQSENRLSKNETRFNVFHSQNINKNLNFEFIYNQTRSQGQYLNQENKFHNIGLVTSYTSDKFLSHTNIIFNRLQTMENGGLEANQPLNSQKKTENLSVQMDDALNKVQNNTFITTNEYRVGKSVVDEADTSGYVVETFIPRVGFIHSLEFSGNKRKFTKDNPNNFFKNIYTDSIFTNDSVKYTRLTNIFQIKFYEAPDRKYTFGKRAYIGNDQLWYNISTKDGYYPKSYTNTFVGGGIFRNEGTFWQFAAEGRIYLTGYRTGQTEFSGFINKPLKIGKDTTSWKIEGSLKSMVPEYFDQYFYSNHFQWQNNFGNIKEMTIRSSIESTEYRTTVGINYSLIGNYIYNNTNTMPAQAGSELLLLSAYIKKDIESKHWLIRGQLLAQKASNENYIHIPAFAGFLSLNFRTVLSKVLYTQLGIDTRYNSAFYADAYEPSTARFYLQNEQLIGKYPYIDLHANLKLKRTRLFFILMNAGSELVGNNYFVAPNYPYYRRTFRLGVSWSFYD